MICKGAISSVDLARRRARVTFRDLDDGVTAEIPYADHVTPEINNTAVVAVFSESLGDAMIIAARKEA